MNIKHDLTDFQSVIEHFNITHVGSEANIGFVSYNSMGKVMSIRRIGKIAFYKVRRGEHEIQLVFKKSVTNNIEAQNVIHYGDWISFNGDLGYTSTKEVSVFVTDFEILQKCYSQMPEKHAGVSEITAKHNRHLDLMTNTDSIFIFNKRAEVIKRVRKTFDHLLEVETPSLHKQASGASATPFKTHHEASNAEMHLRISPELNLKKLMVGNISTHGVFEIGKSFRNEGLSSRHNPEFTMVEAYEYAESADPQKAFKEMLAKITNIIETFYPNKDIKSWSFMDWTFHEKFSSLEESQENFDNIVEPELLKNNQENILVVTHHFSSSSPLAMHLSDKYSARCEVYVNGIEVMNAYVEQNNAEQQRKAFEAQGFVDEEYLDCLSYGMPMTIGIGIGIDRLVMTMLNLSSIKDVILFPQ